MAHRKYNDILLTSAQLELRRLREREEAYTGFWWGNLKERDHLENPGVDGRTILRWIFRKWDVGGVD
jgi:hypothetical protein